MTQTDYSYTADMFESYIQMYYVHPQQKIYNITSMYDSINKYTEPTRSSIFELCSRDRCSDTFMSRDMTDIEMHLYDASQTIKISNGDPSEIWCSIIYNGILESSVSNGNKSGVTTDVSVGSQRLSIKSHKSRKSSHINLGRFQKVSERAVDEDNLYQIIDLLRDISGQRPSINKSTGKETAGLGREDLNRVLDRVESTKVTEQVREILQIETSVSVFQRIQEQIRSLTNQYSMSLSEGFCRVMDTSMYRHTHAVDRWILLDSYCSPYHIWTIDSDTLYERAKCTTEHRLSNCIASLDGGYLWILSDIFKNIEG